MEAKKNANIEIEIKYGKGIKKAEFNVFNSNGLIICNSIYVEGNKIPIRQQAELFSKNCSAIKKEYYKTYGNL